MKGNCSLSSTFRRFVSSCQMQLLRIIISSILATNVLISAPGSQQSPGNLSIVAKELLFRYLILIRGYYSFPVPFCCWWWTYPLLCFWNYYCYFEMHKTSSSTLLSGLQPASQGQQQSPRKSPFPFSGWLDSVSELLLLLLLWSVALPTTKLLVSLGMHRIICEIIKPFVSCSSFHCLLLISDEGGSFWFLTVSSSSSSLAVEWWKLLPQ